MVQRLRKEGIGSGRSLGLVGWRSWPGVICKWRVRLLWLLLEDKLGVILWGRWRGSIKRSRV